VPEIQVFSQMEVFKPELLSPVSPLESEPELNPIGEYEDTGKVVDDPTLKVDAEASEPFDDFAMTKPDMMELFDSFELEEPEESIVTLTRKGCVAVPRYGPFEDFYYSPESDPITSKIPGRFLLFFGGGFMCPHDNVPCRNTVGGTLDICGDVVECPSHLPPGRPATSTLKPARQCILDSGERYTDNTVDNDSPNGNMLTPFSQSPPLTPVDCRVRNDSNPEKNLLPDAGEISEDSVSFPSVISVKAVRQSIVIVEGGCTTEEYGEKRSDDDYDDSTTPGPLQLSNCWNLSSDGIAVKDFARIEEKSKFAMSLEQQSKEPSFLSETGWVRAENRRFHAVSIPPPPFIAKFFRKSAADETPELYNFSESVVSTLRSQTLRHRSSKSTDLRRAISENDMLDKSEKIVFSSPTSSDQDERNIDDNKLLKLVETLEPSSAFYPHSSQDLDSEHTAHDGNVNPLLDDYIVLSPPRSNKQSTTASQDIASKIDNSLQDIKVGTVDVVATNKKSDVEIGSSTQTAVPAKIKDHVMESKPVLILVGIFIAAIWQWGQYL
jgi:hypothetical protein